MRLIKVLEGHGILDVARGRGRGHVNHYRLKLDCLFSDSGSTNSETGIGDDTRTISTLENVTAAHENVTAAKLKGDECDSENVTTDAPDLVF
jgi:hypothetical protein